MVTKEELLEAWEIIARFCNEQDDCEQCFAFEACFTAFDMIPLNEAADKFIEELKE